MPLHGKKVSQRVQVSFSKIFLLVLLIVLPTLVAKSQVEPTCTKEILEDCYQEAIYLFRNKDYEGARDLFEKIVGIDVTYKKASKYLKKCHAKATKELVKKQTADQLKIKKEQEFRVLEEAKGEKEARGKAQEEEILKALEEGPSQEPPTIEYRIGVGDIIEISVWRNADLDRNVIVRPDGIISYTLVGDIPAVGLSLTELDETITEALKDYVRNPVVSVAVQKFGGTKVLLLGESRGQGVFSPPGGGTVLDVIAQAGGFTDKAVKRGVILVRTTQEGPKVYRLNLARVFKGDLSQNIPVQSNDIIYVPKTFFAHIHHAIAQLSPILTNTLLGTSVTRDLRELLK